MKRQRTNQQTSSETHCSNSKGFTPKTAVCWEQRSTHTFTESKRGGFILQELRQSSKRNIYNGDVTLGNLFGQAKKLVSPSASRSRGTLNWNSLQRNQHGYQVWLSHGTNFGTDVFVWLNWHLNDDAVAGCRICWKHINSYFSSSLGQGRRTRSRKKRSWGALSTTCLAGKAESGFTKWPVLGDEQMSNWLRVEHF